MFCPKKVKENVLPEKVLKTVLPEKVKENSIEIFFTFLGQKQFFGFFKQKKNEKK
jgi:hypothetical protein